MSLDHPKKKIIFIGGPTAVGKTAVGISLANKINGEIISCDSMQIYQEIQIASNKPSDEEVGEVPHHMLNIISLTQDFDVVQFEKMAKSLIEDIFRRDKIPIVVGGTGMYMKVLIDGIFDGGNVPDRIHQQVLQEIQEKGCLAAHEALKTLDPISSEKIHPNDERRIIRALEVFYSTGRPISELQKESSGLKDKYDIVIFGLTMDRKQLYDRINNRVDQMFDEGLLEEIRAIKDVKVSKTANAIIGIKEVRSFLLGQCSLEEAKEEMKKSTRHLAKRQMTWFRAEKRLEWIDITEEKNIDQIAENIFIRIKGNLC